MHYIGGKDHKPELRSKRNYLINHTKFKSRHYIVIYGLGVDIHTHISVIPRNQAHAGQCVPDLTTVSHLRPIFVPEKLRTSL